jgi:uncharacterized protein with PhoU and TrkA domain
MTRDRRDTNQAEIVAAAEKIGAACVQQSRTAGFDILVLYRGKLHVVEIKNGKRWALTPNESKMLDECIRQGVEYNIITSVDEMVEMLNKDVV